MTTPQDPEEEPVSDELADERPDERALEGPAEGPAEGPGEAARTPPADRDGLSEEDALWQAIVDNYGERPQIEELDRRCPTVPAGPDRSRRAGAG